MLNPIVALALVLAQPAAAAPSALDELRALIPLQRTAHLNYDAALLVNLFAEDFVVIDGGRVTRPTRAESLRRFRHYFETMRFLAWDDIDPPVIVVSPDGRLATVVVTKLVRAVPRAAGAGGAVTETRFAWLETWRRDAAGWRMIQLASTRE
ncbi:MAG TPA: nuclear transport factor 2 family protein [Allosphingosinicella sp.]|nr:nuclear transport factor 2 family protein [Allosphingosinicella sp.]